MKKLALLFSLLFLIPFAASASGLVNINTADATLLETLTGIGPSKATAIISYRTQHGSFAKIADIQNVSGIGPSTYAGIEASITVEGASTASVPASAAVVSATSSSSKISSGPAPAPEPAVVVDAGADRVVVAGAEAAYTANVSEDGALYSSPEVHWTWGDGSSSTGAAVYKSYRLPGTYVASVGAVAGMGSGSSEFQVVVKDAQVSLSSISSDGITITNDDASDTLDLSRWQLSAGGAVFTMPPGTRIVAGGSVTFAPEITGLMSTADAILLYPSGQVAARYGAAVVTAQPSPAAVSSYKGSSIISPAHAVEQARAPAASTQVAAAGAALPPGDAESAPASLQATGSLLAKLESPWTLGFLGLLVFSAGAFILL